MPQLPFDIPRSLSSYAEQFDGHPEKAISRLQAHLEKRGPNAVGYALLAWFFHLQSERDEAVRQAMLARIYAPGSPFLEKLPYFLSHPDLLEAWTPEHPPEAAVSRRDRRGPVMADLDRLIERLSRVESKTVPSGHKPADPPEEPAEKLENVDDIASDTLADIHARQGKTRLAISLYKRLMKRDDRRKEYYRDQIRKLEEQQEEDREGDQ